MMKNNRDLINLEILANHTQFLIVICLFVICVPFTIAFGMQDILIKMIGSNWWVMPLIIATVLATACRGACRSVSRHALATLLFRSVQHLVLTCQFTG